MEKGDTRTTNGAVFVCKTDTEFAGYSEEDTDREFPVAVRIKDRALRITIGTTVWPALGWDQAARIVRFGFEQLSAEQSNGFRLVDEFDNLPPHRQQRTL